MSPILSSQELATQLDPLLIRAGLFSLVSLQKLSPDLNRFREQLTQRLPTVWFGAPWGSWSFFGMSRADQFDDTNIAQFMDQVFEIACSLFSSKEQWVIETGIATVSGTRPLGVFGRILFVWESIPRIVISQVQGAKRSRSFGRCCIVPWVAVLPERRVYGHKGLPFTMGAPSVNAIQRLISG